MTRKMIIMDLDGTLLHSNKKCSDDSMQYLKFLKDKGYIIVLATGRVLNSAIRVTEGANFANYIISNGGGIIYDIQNKDFLYKNKIDIHMIKRFYLNYEKYLSSFCMCGTDYYYRYHPLSAISIDDQNIEDVITFLQTHPDIYHLCLHFNQDINVNNIKPILQSEFSDLYFLVMQDSFSKNQWMDVFNAKVSKYNTILHLADICNIDNKDIIAFGDGLNDQEMLEKCSIGVAMGNALQQLKTNANYITLSNNEDGIITFLKQYLGEFYR